jgi:hypothetical protein
MNLMNANRPIGLVLFSDNLECFASEPAAVGAAIDAAADDDEVIQGCSILCT